MHQQLSLLKGQRIQVPEESEEFLDTISGC